MEIKEISRETIELLLELMKKTIGKNGVDTISNLTDMNLQGKELFYAFTEEIMKIYGDKGAFSIVRQLGNDLAKNLMERYSPDIYPQILKNFLREFGFARQINLEDTKISVCSCVFYEFLKENNLQPVQHAVCWLEVGFMEGFLRQMKGIKGIRWKERDYENKLCYFEFIK